MAATCNFCHRVFKNQQGVRAHLKHCKIYKHHQGKAPSKQPQSRKGSSPGEKRQFYPSIGATIVEDDSNSIYSDIHPEEFQRRQRASEAQENAQKQGRTPPRKDLGQLRKEQALRAESERSRLLEDQKREEQRRRARIQEIKESVIDRYLLFRKDVPVEAKGRAKVEIEKVFEKLPISELPASELIQIAEGIREEIYAPYLKSTASTETVREEERDMKKRLYSGLYWCTKCEAEYEIDLADKDALVCDECNTSLEEIPDEEEEDDDN
jgi:hypothetical protein